MSGQVIEYKPTVKCDYCGKTRDECELLFQAPGGLIHVCDECVMVMGEILAVKRVEWSKLDNDESQAS